MTRFGSVAQTFSPTQRLAFFALCVVAATILSHGTKPPTLAVALALIGIAIAVWHGAFDGVLARPVLRPRFGRRWPAVFAGSYLLLIVVVAALWYFAPSFALPLFLLYSAWHFGTEGHDGTFSWMSAVQAFALGFLPIAASCFWHPVQVRTVFALMLRSSAPFAATLTATAGAALLPLVIVLVACASLARQDIATWVLLGLELLLFWRVDPLIAFAVFFCCWHTPEHLAASCTSRSGRLSFRTMGLQLRSGLLAWLVSLVGLGILVAAGSHRLLAIASSVFILLSALTVPHMLLNELRRRTGRAALLCSAQGVSHAL